MQVLQELLRSSQLVCLQEVHGCLGDLATLAIEAPSFLHFGSFASSPAVGGVVTSISKLWLQHCVLRPQILQEGRCLLIESLEEPRFMAINIHINPSDTLAVKKLLIDRIVAQTSGYNSPVFIMGDFNCIVSGECRFSLETLLEMDADPTLAKYIEEHLEGYVELHQGGHTRRQVTNGVFTTLSRLDRIYVNLHPAVLMDMHPHTSTTHLITDPTFPSDHVPVRAVLCAPLCAPPGTHRVPAWVTGHPDFKEHTRLALIDLGLEYRGLEDIHMLKEVLHTAAAAIKAGEAIDDPQCPHQRLHWALLLLRGFRSRDARACRRACRAFPGLSDFFDSAPFELRMDSFLPFLQTLAQTQLAEMTRALEADARMTEWKRIGKRDALRRRAAVWATRRRSASTFAILDSQGIPAPDYAAAAQLLQNHWRTVFAAPLVQQTSQDEVLGFVVEAPDVFDWSFDQSTFKAVLSTLCDSSPGPDGLPYSAWQHADETVTDCLYAAFCDFAAGEALPSDFNFGHLVFIPKGEEDGDPVQVRRHVSDVRPISLSDTCSKLFANMINEKLTKLAKATVLPQQRGFVRGRSLIDNVLEIEAMALRLAKFFVDHSGLVLFDFKAAFPSLAHSWIFAVLRKMRLPAEIIAMLEALYHGCRMNIVIGGVTDVTISVEAGIKQGCPASGSLFALALDPFVRLLCLRIPPPLGTFVAFADDLAAALRHLNPALRRLEPLFTLLSTATGLHLNYSKVVVVPLGLSTKFSVKRFLVEALPMWSAMKVEDCAKLLGVFLGPGADACRWSLPAEKYRIRAKEAKASCNGIRETIRHYKVYALSTLAHLMQFSDLPPEVLHMETVALQGLTRGPFSTFPGTTLAALHDLGLSFEGPSAIEVNRAAMFRAAISSKVFFSCRSLYNGDNLPDDALLHPRSLDWEASSCFSALERNFRYITQIAPNIDPTPTDRMQETVHRLLRSRRPSPWANLLLSRIGRWLQRPSPILVHLMLRRVADAAHVVPSEIIFAWLRLVLNGFPTTARMGPEAGPCHLCGALGLDRLEHVVHCDKLNDVISKHFPFLHRAPGPVLRWETLCLVNVPQCERSQREMFVFADFLFFALNAKRHGSKATPMELSQARRRAISRRFGASLLSV
jgi:hypothetical protein